MRFTLVMASLLMAPCGPPAFGQQPDTREIFETTDVNRCGPYSLQACANFLDVPIRQADISRHLIADGRETSFGELTSTARKLGLATVAVRWASQPDLVLPAILAIKQKGRPHFIAAVALREERILIIDFPHELWVPVSVLRNKHGWNGEALHIGKSKVSVWWLYFRIYWKRFLFAAVALTLTIFVLRRWLRHHRKTLQAAALLLWGVCLCSAVGCGVANSQSPIARIDPETSTLRLSDGTNESGEIETVLLVKNEGSTDLRITRIAASCSCSSIDPPPEKNLRPGDVFKIGLRIRPPDIGMQIVNVSVDVESGSKRGKLSSAIRVRGRPIHPPTLIKALEQINLQAGPDGNASTKMQIHAYERMGSPPWITDVIVEGPALTGVDMVDMHESEGPDPETVRRLYIIQIYATDNSDKSKDGLQANYVILCGALAESPVGRIPVAIRKWDPLRLSPSTLFVNLRNRSSEPITRDVRLLVAAYGFEPKTVNTVTADGWIDATISAFSERAGDKEASIRVKINPAVMPAGTATMRGSVEVEASDDRGRTASKRLQIIVKR